MARQLWKVEGVENVKKNLVTAIKDVGNNTEQGVKAAGTFIQAEAQEITPQRKGVLINSSFNQLVNTDKGVNAVVGFSADYAAAVHEMPDDTNWTKPGSENKFLEKAVTRNITTILNIIRRFASRKPDGLK